MTSQQAPNQIDQKKGSADERTSDQHEGAFGKHIAAGENLPPPAEEASSRDEASGDAQDTIPEQPGCGPSVTDYPGLGAPRH